MSNGITYIDADGDLVFVDPENAGDKYVIASKDPANRPKMSGDLSGSLFEQTVSKIRGIDSPDPLLAADGSVIKVSAPKIFTAPYSIYADNDHIYVGQYENDGRGGVIGGCNIFYKLKINSTNKNNIDYFESIDTLIYGSNSVKCVVGDDNYVYASFNKSGGIEGNSIAIIEKETFFIVGWAYLGDSFDTMDMCLDAYGNLYCYCSTVVDFTTSCYLKKFVVSSCIGKQITEKTSDSELYISDTNFNREYSVYIQGGTQADDRLVLTCNNLIRVNLSGSMSIDASIILDEGVSARSIFNIFNMLWIDGSSGKIYFADTSEVMTTTGSTLTSIDYFLPSSIGERHFSYYVGGMGEIIFAITDMGKLILIDSTNKVILQEIEPVESGSIDYGYNYSNILNVNGMCYAPFPTDPSKGLRGNGSILSINLSGFGESNPFDLMLYPKYRQEYSALDLAAKDIKYDDTYNVNEKISMMEDSISSITSDVDSISFTGEVINSLYANIGQLVVSDMNDVSYSGSSVFMHTLTENITTFGIYGAIFGKVNYFKLFLKQDSGNSYTFSPPSEWRYQTGLASYTSPDSATVDVIFGMSIDNGSTWMVDYKKGYSL